MESLKKAYKPVLLIVFWLAFARIWVGSWQNVEIFSAIWWFDTLGHATYGYFGFFTFLFIFISYAARGYFRIAGKVFLSVVIILIITVGGALWEGGELWWDLHLQPDFFAWAAKAQKGSADTTIDILTNILFAMLAALSYWTYNKWHAKRYPDEYEKEKIAEAKIKIEHLSQEIHLSRREHIKQEIKPAVRELLQGTRKLSRSIRNLLQEAKDRKKKKRI